MSMEEPRRRKGLLAFLEDSATLFPHDADACKKKVMLPLRKQQQRRRRQRRSSQDETPLQQQQQQQDNEEEMTPTTLSERLAIQKPCVVILFFCDAQQAYSIQVRNRILQVLYHNDSGSTSPHRNPLVQGQEQQQSSCDILCCIVSLGGGRGGDSGESSSSFRHTVSPATREFARSTGMLVTRVASSMALHHIFLPRVQGYPHLMLVRASTGQAFGSLHEDLALEWNRPETVRQRWCAGQPGLDCVQQTLSTVLFPTACSIL